MCKQKIASTITSHEINKSTGKCVCGYTEKVTACSHTTSIRKTIEAATCTLVGKYEIRCSKCNELIENGTIPAKGHTASSSWTYESAYHYKLCTVCKQKIASTITSHEINKSTGKCVCGYTELQNILKCEHKNVIGLTCMKDGKCQDCGQVIKATGHVFSEKAGYSSDSNGHYLHCEICDVVSNKFEKHKDLEKDGKCSVCGWVCTNHSYKFIRKSSNESYYKCEICGYIYDYEKTQECDHNFEMKVDSYGHYSICTKCGKKDMYDSKGNVDLKKYGAHDYGEVIDLCNGKHARTCKICGYKFESVHVYTNFKDKDGNYYKNTCVACGSSNSTGIQNVNNEIYEFDVNSEDIAKAIQEILVAKGYEIGKIDGIIGKKTIDAINELLRNQGSTRQIESVNDITDEIYTLIKNCKETKEESDNRIAREQLEILEEKFYKGGTLSDDEKTMLCKAKLSVLGYYVEDITDLEFSINEFCRLNGIDDTGINSKNFTDDFLKKLLNSNVTYGQAKDRAIKEIIDNPERFDSNDVNRIIEMQTQLKILGYYTGPINGKYDKDTKVAIRQLLEDKGMVEDYVKRKFNNEKEQTSCELITDLIDIEVYKAIMTKEEKGMELLETPDPNDKSYLGVVQRLTREYAAHGFVYVQWGYSYELTDNDRNGMGGAPTIDCSGSVTSFNYEYARINDCKYVMKLFETPRNTEDYSSICKKDGKITATIDGVKVTVDFFTIVDRENIQAGDIFITDGKGHTEIYAGGKGSNGKPSVYNLGNDEAIRAGGPTDSSRSLNKYNVMRAPTEEELKLIDEEIRRQVESAGK